METEIVYRTTVHPDDHTIVRDIVSSTGFFTRAEIDIAVELVQEQQQKGLDSGYHFLFAEKNQKTIGYSCFGLIPATRYSYDLYWIAVHSTRQGHGIGKELLAESEKIIKNLGGTRIYIDTSSRDLYKPTYGFYRSCGYHEVAVLDDFYAPGDAKIIYLKLLP